MGSDEGSDERKEKECRGGRREGGKAGKWEGEKEEGYEREGMEKNVRLFSPHALSSEGYRNQKQHNEIHTHKVHNT